MEFTFHNEPPGQWDELCRSRNDIFNSPEWHDFLSKGLGSRTIYGWHKASSTGISITVFSAGPFKIGYVGFPTGCIFGNKLNNNIVDALRKARFPITIQSIRIIGSPFKNNSILDLPCQELPETAILDLDKWAPEKNIKLRQDMNRIRRSLLTLAEADDVIYGKKMFSLYRDTVARNCGSLRYSEAYFKGLIDLSLTHPDIRCILATLKNEIAAFEVTVCHGCSGYSLHGCINPKFRAYSPSDLLTYEAVNWAKKQGMDQYNLMASPRDRVSLVRYKEKWGGVTANQRVYDLILRPWQNSLFKNIKGVYEKTHRLAGRFSR